MHMQRSQFWTFMELNSRCDKLWWKGHWGHHGRRIKKTYLTSGNDAFLPFKAYLFIITILYSSRVLYVQFSGGVEWLQGSRERNDFPGSTVVFFLCLPFGRSVEAIILLLLSIGNNDRRRHGHLDLIAPWHALSAFFFWLWLSLSQMTEIDKKYFLSRNVQNLRFDLKKCLFIPPKNDGLNSYRARCDPFMWLGRSLSRPVRQPPIN